MGHRRCLSILGLIINLIYVKFNFLDINDDLDGSFGANRVLPRALSSNFIGTMICAVTNRHQMFPNQPQGGTICSLTVSDKESHRKKIHRHGIARRFSVLICQQKTMREIYWRPNLVYQNKKIIKCLT
jgi:hypothetical protein